MKKKLKNIVLVILCTVSLLSCESFLEIDTPVQEIVTIEVFQSRDAAEAAIVGLYSRMSASNNQAMNGFLSIYGGLLADEVWNTSANSGFDAFKDNELVSTTTILAGNLWNPLYNYIYHANAILEGLHLSTVLSETDKEQFLGEAYFTRAICYFYLVNLFGEVPLVLETDYHKNRALPTSSVEVIYERIVNDLLLAERYLPISYDGNLRIRPNRYAAKGLLARVYLYLKKYELAELKSTEVISVDEMYAIEGDLNIVFMPNSKEALWQIFPTNTSYNSAEAFAFIPSSPSARPTIAIYQSLFDEFESVDKRLIEWTGSVTIGGTDYVYPYKYRIRSSLEKLEYNTVLRLAEQFLIRAEAKLGQMDVAKAVADINILRSRANLDLYPDDLSEDACWEALILEKRLEFFAEWGHRWLDLKRWGLLHIEMPKTKPTWNLSSLDFPIPETELFRNPSLKK